MEWAWGGGEPFPPPMPDPKRAAPAGIPQGGRGNEGKPVPTTSCEQSRAKRRGHADCILENTALAFYKRRLSCVGAVKWKCLPFFSEHPWC